MPRRLSTFALLVLLLGLGLVLIACTGRGRSRGGGGGGENSGGGSLSDFGDPDEDGLTTSFENQIGTNPSVADTDGDGFSDAHEVLAYFRPDDATDFPYEGGYPRLPLPDEFTGEGWNEGEVSHDWDGEDSEDSFGEQVNLARFYGNVVLIEVAAEWCGPCRTAAPEVQSEYEELKDQGFVTIHLLLDGLTLEDPPDPDRWRGDFDLTFPVVGDQDQSIAHNYIEGGGAFSIPNFSILGRDLTIEAKYLQGAPDWGLIEDLLDEDLPEVDWPLPDNAEELREELGIEAPSTY